MNLPVREKAITMSTQNTRNNYVQSSPKAIQKRNQKKKCFLTDHVTGFSLFKYKGMFRILRISVLPSAMVKTKPCSDRSRQL